MHIFETNNGIRLVGREAVEPLAAGGKALELESDLNTELLTTFTSQVHFEVYEVARGAADACGPFTNQPEHLVFGLPAVEVPRNAVHGVQKLLTGLHSLQLHAADEKLPDGSRSILGRRATEAFLVTCVTLGFIRPRYLDVNYRPEAVAELAAKVDPYYCPIK